MDGTLVLLIDIHKPNGFDWMNFKLTKNNPYTYHHIVERRNGGPRTLDNGAILTSIGHNLLNILDIYCPDAYNDLQNVFTKINSSKDSPTDEIIGEVDNILYRVLVSKEYKFLQKVDLSKYRRIYQENRKELKKCLK